MKLYEIKPHEIEQRAAVEASMKAIIDAGPLIAVLEEHGEMKEVWDIAAMGYGEELGYAVPYVHCLVSALNTHCLSLKKEAPEGQRWRSILKPFENICTRLAELDSLSKLDEEIDSKDHELYEEFEV